MDIAMQPVRLSMKSPCVRRRKATLSTTIYMPEQSWHCGSFILLRFWTLSEEQLSRAQQETTCAICVSSCRKHSLELPLCVTRTLYWSYCPTIIGNTKDELRAALRV